MSDTMKDNEKAGPEPAQDGTEQEMAVQLERCKAEVEQWKERFVHVSADLDNFTRRINKERLQWAHRSQEMILVDLLTIVDDFDRSMQEQKKLELSQDMKTWLSGFTMIHTALKKLLEKYDVKEITQVTVFDPVLHEALAQVDAPERKSGDIVQVMQKGYYFKDAVLRPAKVSVAK